MWMSVSPCVQANPNDQLYPIFQYFENWCQAGPRPKPSPHSAKPFLRCAQPFSHCTEPFPHCAKPLRRYAKPFPLVPKLFPHCARPSASLLHCPRSAASRHAVTPAQRN